jgi:hypothetical protein
MSLVEFAEARTRESSNKPLPPIWAGDTLKSHKNFIKWFSDTRPILEEHARRMIEDAWSNLLWYTGEYLPLQSMRFRTPDGRDVEVPRQLSPFVINYLAYLTDKRASDLSIYKANHEVLPETDTEDDRMGARALSQATQYIKRAYRIDDLFNRAEKWNMVFSHIYVGTDWNGKIGDRKKDEKGKLTNEREGDVEVKLIDPWHILLWPTRNYEKVPFAVQVMDVLHVEEAKKRYNNLNIKPGNESSLFTFSSPFVEEIRPEEVVIYRSIYKPDEFLEHGVVIEHTKDMVLKWEDKNYPWSHKQFPWARYTDIDVPGRLYPISFYQHVKPMQHTYNNLSGLLKKYIFTVGHPKWSMVRGACNIKSLGNAATIIQHRPGQPPVLNQVRSIGPDPFTFRDALKNEMTLFANSHQISLGNLPPNTRSGIMISRLQEIENRQRGPQIDKRNEFMAEVLLQIASIIGDHYPLQSKERLARVVGKNLVDEVIGLKDVNVYSQYNYLIRNPSGFSAEMSGRLEEIAFINQNIGPNLLTEQQKLDIIGIGLENRYYDAKTAALKAAQKENQLMSDGKEVPPPEEHEDHISHWNEHMLDVQMFAFKKLPRKIQNMKIDHIMGHEELMTTLAINPAYGQRLLMLDGFPRFYVPPPQPTQEELTGAPPPEAMMPQEAPPAAPQEPSGLRPELLAALMQANGNGGPRKKTMMIGPKGEGDSRKVEITEE